MRNEELHLQVQYKLMEELYASEKRYRELVEHIRDVVFQCDEYCNILFLNNAWAEILGYSVEESMGMNFADYVLDSDHEKLIKLFSEELSEDCERNSLELQFKTKDGNVVWLLLSVRNGDGGNKIGSIHDIHDRKIAERIQKELNESLEIRVRQRTYELEVANAKLERLSQIDGLTGLYNRRYFDTYLEKEFKKSCRYRWPISLVMCDIDYFKQYNDTYGHQAGDDCLKKVAQEIMKNTKRPNDIAARYGGEEFCVVLGNTGVDGALRMAELMREGIERLAIPHSSSCVKSVVSMSFGVSTVIPEFKMSCAEVVRLADKSLYKSKCWGRDRITTVS